MSFRFSAIQGAMTSHSRSYGEDLQRSKVLKLGVRKSNKTYGQLLIFVKSAQGVVTRYRFDEQKRQRCNGKK